MAQVQLEELIDHLRPTVRRALEDAVNEVIDDADYDSGELFRAFRRAIRRRCSTWASVPNQFVKDD